MTDTLRVRGLRIDTDNWNGRMVWRTGGTLRLPCDGGTLTQIVDADGRHLFIRDWLLAKER